MTGSKRGREEERQRSDVTFASASERGEWTAVCRGFLQHQKLFPAPPRENGGAAQTLDGQMRKADSPPCKQLRLEWPGAAQSGGVMQKRVRIIQINKRQTSSGGQQLRRVAGPSPRPLAGDKDEHPADGDEAVFERGHGEDGELGPILQRKNSQEPPAPGGTAGTGLGDTPTGSDTWLRPGWPEVRLNPPAGPGPCWEGVRSG